MMSLFLQQQHMQEEERKILLRKIPFKDFVSILNFTSKYHNCIDKSVDISLKSTQIVFKKLDFSRMVTFSGYTVF